MPLNTRRSDINIIADILKLGETNKTQIMYSANMSYRQLEKYLGFLIEKKFLRKKRSERNSGGLFQVTLKGKRLLRHIKKTLELLGEEPVP